MSTPYSLADVIDAVAWIEWQLWMLEEEHPWVFVPVAFRMHRTAYPTAPELQ